MPTFDSWNSYQAFAHSVKRNARYVLDEEARRFIEQVAATCEARRRSLPAGKAFWRAQHGHDWADIEDGSGYEVPTPLGRARMVPLRDQAREGRINPKGIPCLYLCDDRDTAMSEVRPWPGESISVGLFKTTRDLTLIDCKPRGELQIGWYFESPPDPERDEIVWAHIDHAFSEPVTATETTADYAPTQIIAEALRKTGVDGIAYKSMLGKGTNVALFGIDDAQLQCCFLFETKTVDFKFKESANPYYIRREEDDHRGRR